MRNKLMSILLVLIAVAVAIVATVAGNLIWPRHSRTYQHMEAAGPEAEDTDSVVFSSHLPLVLIDTGGVAIEEDEKHPAAITIIDNEGGYNHTTDIPALKAAALINIRGTTSAKFKKKQYRLNFTVSLNSTDRTNCAVMGMPPATDWVLNGPYLDKSLVRNYLMYNLAGEIMQWAPHVRFCEVFLDGEYEGLYLMIEAVTVDKERVNINKKSNLQGKVGFLLLRERVGYTKTPLQSHSLFSTGTAFELGIEYPNPANITQSNIQYIQDRVKAFEDKLYSQWGISIDATYINEIDMKSFVDYYIINEFSINRDAGIFSTYTYCDPRGKLTMGPVWDCNNCFDNFYDSTPYDQLCVANNGWFVPLVLDKTFTELVIFRYHELRESILSEDRLLKMIDDIVAYLGPAIDRNFKRWDDVLTKPMLLVVDNQPDRNSYSYATAVNQLKNSIIDRGRFLDDNLSALFRQYNIDYANLVQQP